MKGVLTISCVLLCCSALLVTALDRAGDKRFIFGPIQVDFPIGGNSAIDCRKCYDCECHHHCIRSTDLRSIWWTCWDQFHKSKNCNAPNHQHGGWSNWYEWDQCVGLCTQASRSRTRACINPVPYNCGEYCKGEDSQTDNTCVPSNCGHSNPLMAASTPRPTTEATTEATTASTTTTMATTQTTTVAPSPTMMSTEGSTRPPPASNPVSDIIHTPLLRAAGGLSETRPVYLTCNKLCAITAVTQGERVSAPQTRACDDSTMKSSEALPAHCCGQWNSSNLQMGPKVMAECASFPKYSPVASFVQGKLQKGTEGIMVGCLETEHGFLLIRQDCTEVPSLVHVNSTQTMYPNPNSYHALVLNN